MLRLSIIVPFYNVEAYIEECIRSLYNQDIPQEQYEIICVDDCSPDGSRVIVERLQEEFPTLKLICHEKNKKLGGARNTGLIAARGEYIWYVDSDDYIYPNVLGKLLAVAESNTLDILQFDHVRGGQRQEKDLQISDIINGEAYLFEKPSYDWFYKLSGAWKQLFRRDYLNRIQLRYIEDAMFEDTDYLLHAFLLADRVQYISMDAYFYRVNNESVTIAPISPLKLAWKVNQVIRCAKFIKLTHTSRANVTIRTMVANTLSQLRKDVKKFSWKERKEYIRHLKGINICRTFVSWRTWLAIRYGITLFV